ncbi:MAG: nucleoside-diphosphate sugar epimerase/dehydratase [Chloroflexota bacterium]
MRSVATLRSPRQFLVLVLQLVILVAVYVMATWKQHNFEGNWIATPQSAALLVPWCAIQLVSMVLFRLHQGIWRYASTVDLTHLVQSASVATVAFAAVAWLGYGAHSVSLEILISLWTWSILALGGVRLVVRRWHERTEARRLNQRRVVIVGAGGAGAALARQALSAPWSRLSPVAFVDDAPAKHGTTVAGIPVIGGPSTLPAVVEEYRADLVIIAIPTATPDQMRRLVTLAEAADVPFQTVAGTAGVVMQSDPLRHVRNVNVADLLGRSPANIDLALVRRGIAGRRVLVTGAAGSVGSELTALIASLEPSTLIVTDRAENPLFFEELELRQRFPSLDLVVRVLDVTDRPSVDALLSDLEPEVIFHAAAHKHVPLMENTPAEAIRNNIGGTLTLAEAARRAAVDRFVLVSTDKAVEPSSVMGATKRVAELVLAALNEPGGTKFISVRFGNVLGSNGSVVPIFQRQIAAGGPVTVTHPEMTRFFMSLPEAAGLIVLAAAYGDGGETFILDMGEPVRIVDLAELMIRLSGYEPYTEMPIAFTGLRPGEKLVEQLTYSHESLRPTGHDRLLHMDTDSRDPEVVLREVHDLLERAPYVDGATARAMLGRLAGLVTADVVS